MDAPSPTDESSDPAGYFSLDNNSIMPRVERQDEALEHSTINHMDFNLYDALVKDDIDVFKEMEVTLNVGDQLTATECTVLHLACQYGSVRCVEHILSTHVSLLLKTNLRDESVLHMAARQGHCEVVEALISAAKSCRQQSESTPHTSTNLIESLIRTPNVEHETPLHEAVRYKHKNVVQLLVNEDPIHSHPQNKHGETPLYLASTRCYTDIITTLLCNCEQPTFGGPDGRTALHAAVLDDGGQCRPHEILQISECVKLILDNHKDLIKVQDNYGWTIFHYVACNDLYTIVDDLIGTDTSVAYLPDYNYKRTALHVAAYKGNIRVMEKLEKYFPDCWEMVDKNSQNIFHIAVEQGRKEVIRYILSKGCKSYRNLLIQRDKEGNTPLHLVTKLGCYVQELMEESAIDWEVLNRENLTPLDLMHCEEEINNTLTDQVMVRRTFVNSNVKKHCHLLRIHKEADIEKANRVVIQNEKDTKEVEELKKLISTHMVVAALIATVALTAGFTMPGGFDGNAGPTQGSAILLRKQSFKAFIVTDTLALLLSIFTLLFYFLTTMYTDVDRVRILFFTSVLLNLASIGTILIAFITGTYAVLDHSSSLAIGITVFSSFYIYLVFVIFSGMYIAVCGYLLDKIGGYLLDKYIKLFGEHIREVLSRK